MRKSYILTLFFFSFFINMLSAQLTGKIVDASNEQPLEFATVSVFNLPDSTLITGEATDTDGRFSVSLEPGRYYIKVDFLTYETQYVDGINIVKKRKKVELGTIGMGEKATALPEIEVVAERSQMELKLDKRVFNVGTDLTNAGLTAADILDNVPSVTVDTEGNVSLRGSQNVRILVDGKPSGLLSAENIEALRRMQGDIIAQVEVITNPSARYEAEGEAGIINIILKKDKERGLNGSFGATIGQPHNYGASYNLNYRQSNLNFFSNFGIDYRRTPGGGFTTQRFFENGQLDEFYTSDWDQERGGVGGNLQLGTDWFINEKNTLTGSLLYRASDGESIASVVYRDFDGDQNLINETIRDNIETGLSHNFEVDLVHEKKFDQKDRVWTTNFKYILEDDTELADFEIFTSGEPNPLIQETSNTEDETNWLIQSDYVQPIGKSGKIETGLRAAFREIDNDYFVKEQDSNGDFFFLPGFNDRLIYTENIYAAYFIAAKEWDWINLQVGVRSEYSDVQAKLLESDSVNNQNYLNFFPSASLVFKFTETQQFQMSFSRRLSRPYFRLLLPFSNFTDARNNPTGNPNLFPEYTNSFELGYLKYLDKGSLLSSIYYRHTTGVIERLILPRNDGTTVRFPVNLSDRYSYGLEVSFSYDPLDWWNLNSDINFFRSETSGRFQDVDYSAETFAWNGRVNSKFKFSKKIDFQTSFSYESPFNTTQGRQLAVYALDVAFSFKVLKNKGTITLSGRDLFNTRRRRTEIDLPDYQATSDFQWRQSRQVVLTLGYRLKE